MPKVRVAIAGLFMVVLAACGGGGEEGGEAPDPGSPAAPAPVTPTGSISYQAEGSTYEAGQYLYLDTLGIELTGTISASVGSTATTVMVDGQDLLLSVPNVAAGNYQLRITAAGKEYTLPMTVENAPLPAAPAAYIQQMLTSVQSQLQALPVPVNPLEAQFLSDLRAELVHAASEINHLDEAQLAQMAYLIAGNDIGEAPAAPAPAAAGRVHAQAVGDACWNTAQSYPATMAVLTVSVVAVAATGKLAVVAPTPVNLLGLALALGNLYYNVERGGEQIDRIMEHCLEPFGNIRFLMASGSPAGDQLEFTSEEPNTYGIGVEARIRQSVHDGLLPKVQYIGSRLQQIRNVIASLATALRVSVVPDFARPFLDYTGKGQVDGDVSEYAIASTSNANITGEIDGSGPEAQVSFSFKSPPANDARVSFSFTMARSATNEPAGTFQAVLVWNSGCPTSLRQQLQAAVVGDWKVTNADGTSVRDLQLLPDGVGMYHVNGTAYPIGWRIVPWNEPRPSYWSPSSSPLHPLGVAPGCILQETGFWHPAYDGLVRSNLQLPVTGFVTYGLGGPFGWPSSGNYFGYDLGTAEKSLTYTKQ